MKPLPRAKLGEPGTVSPKAWNLLVESIEEMQKKLSRITPKSSNDIIHRASTSGFTSHLKRRGGRGSSSAQQGFQVATSGSSLSAVPGLIGETTISSDAVLKVADPADGSWYLIAKVVINATTGEKSTEEVYWDDAAPPSNTSTDFYQLVADATIVSGQVDEVNQYAPPIQTPTA
jgi:hypothetical protein